MLNILRFFIFAKKQKHMIDVRALLIGGLLLMFSSTGLAATEPAKQAELAYRAVVAGENESAIDVYQSLLTQGYESADIYFNLGIAYYQAGHLGQAILQHEKALRLAPWDREIRLNLELLRSEQTDGLAPLPPFIVKEVWQQLAARLSPNAWLIVAILLAWLAAAGFALWLFSKIRQRKRLGFWLGCGLAVLCLLPWGLAQSRQVELARQDRGIVIGPEFPVYVAPGLDADVELTVHDGLWVRLLDEFEGWYKIELVDGRQGWIQQDALELI